MKNYHIFLLALFVVLAARVYAAEPFELKDGDNVVLLGSSYIERMQANNYLETLLTSSQTNRKVTYRNLGWSGDTAGGISRAVFGSPKDGFERLKRDVLLAKPTVVLVNYGANEAFAGEAGLEEFKTQMNELLNFLNSTKARVVLITPHDRTAAPEFGVDPKNYNANLDRYIQAMQRMADDRGLAVINTPRRDRTKSPPPELSRNSDDGIHFSPFGYWRTAPWLASELGEPLSRWELSIDKRGKHKESGVVVSNVMRKDKSVSFDATDVALPPPKPPRFAPRGASLMLPHAVLKVADLPAGDYGLQIDGEPVVRADEKHWALGVRFRRTYAEEQVEELRTAIGVKNELFFHRYRPQNETYLFLFRKHEQGNNAVEIPRFDPLIEAKEKEIARLKVPQKHSFKLVRLEKD